MLLQLLNEGQTEEKQHSFLKTLGIIVLVLCASPIALPSLLTLIVGLFCVVLFVGCIFLLYFVWSWQESLVVDMYLFKVLP